MPGSPPLELSRWVDRHCLATRWRRQLRRAECLALTETIAYRGLLADDAGTDEDHRDGDARLRALEVCPQEVRGEPERGLAARCCALREGEGPRILQGGSRSGPRMMWSVLAMQASARWREEGRAFERTILKQDHLLIYDTALS